MEFYKGTDRPEAGRTGHIYQGEPGSDLHFNDLYNQQLAQKSDGSLDSTNGTLGLHTIDEQWQHPEKARSTNHLI